MPEPQPQPDPPVVDVEVVEIPPPADGEVSDLAAESKAARAQQALVVADRAALDRRDATSAMFDPGAFDLRVRQATALANSTLLPEAMCLTGPKGAKRRLPQNVIIANCMFLVADASRWLVDPYALLPECYPKPGGGGVAYQGKVIAGILNKHLRIRLRYAFTGEGENRVCRCYAYMNEEDPEKPGTRLMLDVEVAYKDAVTKNRDGRVKEAWTKDRDQKLTYVAAIKWGRRHAPELVAGTITAEDLEQQGLDALSTPALPAPPGGVPPSLAAFAGQPSASSDPPPAAPAADPPPARPQQVQPPAPPQGPNPGEAPLSEATFQELKRLARDAGLDDEGLSKLAWRVCRRRFDKLLESDAPVLADVLSRGKS